ncbi:MAG: TraR/DksA C4-type zinc finger protein [Candidatus Paceibacterota bacterium]
MTDIKKYKIELENKLVKITEELKTLGVYEPKTGDWIEVIPEHINEADPNSKADFAEELEENTATLSDLEIDYNNIKRALQKIEDDTFGTCEICQKKIEEARLDFRPEARTCKEHMNEEQNLPL